MSKQLKVIHPHAAGIDIGAEKIFVSVAGQEVKVFATYTASLLEAAQYLISQHIQTVAMEATGVYWIPLYEIREQAGWKYV
jgi:transposase